MYIRETSWSNFRNLKPRRLTWCSGLNLLTGKNGSGKTNMLEALNLVCGWGSFYNAKAKELRAWDAAQNENIEISCLTAGEEQIIGEISVSCASSRISAKLNRERTNFSEFRVRIPALCFLPGEMSLIDGTPAVRRLFIDKLCSILSVPYARRLSDYKRLVRHRIKLLRAEKSPEITSRLISSLGSWIWSVRNSVVNMLDEKIGSDGSRGILSPFPLRIKLKPGGIGDGENLPDNSLIKDKFMERLEYYSDREKAAKIPFVGPHRDDISISAALSNKSDESPAAVLSRGQKRRTVISLILAAGRLMELKLKRKPMFLLDEVFSELDEDARKIVADSLFDTGWQIFATSADNIFSVRSGWRGEIYSLSGGERNRV